MTDLVRAAQRPGRVFEGARRVRLADVSPAGRLRLDAAARFLQDVSADDTADAAPARRRGLGRAQDGHRGGRVPPLPRAARAGDVVLRHREPLGRATHLDRRRAGRRGRGRHHVGALRHASPVARAGSRPGFDAIYGEAAGGRRVKARLDHPDPPDGAPTGSPWPLRFTDFDVLGHVNNAACWQIVEEALAARRDLRAPLRAEVQHRTAIERGATVEVTVADDDGGAALWVCADGGVACGRDRAAVSRSADASLELLDRARSGACRGRRGW